MMEQNTVRDDEIEIDLKEILRVLLSKLWIILLLGFLFGFVVFIYSQYVIDPVYTSTTRVYVLSRQSAETSVTYTDLQTGTQLTKDYVELVKSKTVLNQVLSDLDLDMSTDALAGMINASTTEETRIITITVDNTDVYLAQKIANDLREVASEHIRAVMNLEAVNTVDEADVPTNPSSPNVPRNTLLGFCVGILLGGAFIVIQYMMDDSIRTPDDVERYLQVSVLGSIPVLEEEGKGKKRRKKHHPSTGMSMDEIERIKKREEDIQDDYQD